MLPSWQVVWIAASRLYLGLHTPVDILAGALAGLAVLVCFIAVEGACLTFQPAAAACSSRLLLLLAHEGWVSCGEHSKP